MRALAERRPDLAAPVASALELARSGGYSAVELLLEQGHLREGEWREAQAGAPPQRWGPFEVAGEAGRGQHGVVFRAVRLPGREPCAVKVLRVASSGLEGRQRERFEREARVLARLDHPGIARLLDAGTLDGVPFLATELVPGGSLAEVGPVAPRQVLAWAVAVAEALAYAHAQGVVHRDLKPANVLLDSGARPRLVDFGLAKDLLTLGGLTRSNAALGTLAYAAPEQLVMAGKVGPASDVYSLGAMVFCLLTGAPPFAEVRTIRALFQAQRQGPGPIGPCPGLEGTARPLCEALLGKALSPEPRARPAMRSFAEGLASALGEPGLP